MALDRLGVTAMLAAMLKADTSVLYGTGKLVQAIETDLSLFENARVDVKKPYKMFLKCEAKTPTEVRAQNTDDEFLIDMRIEGSKTNINTTAGNLDDIDSRIELLVNTQMWGGQMFTAYYTDANAQVIDAEYDNGAMTIEEQEGKMIAECEGAIVIRTNRWS